MATFWTFVTAWQQFLAWHATCWDWILAFLSEKLVTRQHFDRVRSTWASLLQFWCLLTIFTASLMAQILASVKPTIKLLPTNFLARVRRLNTINNIFILATPTFDHMLLLARQTSTMMAISLAFVLTAVQDSFAFLTALENLSFFWTFHDSRAFSTLTSY